MIHVCFALYDKTGRYSKFTGTAMLSMFDNTNADVTVHILHDNTLTADSREKFSYIAGRYNQRVKFYNVDELCADRIRKIVALLPTVKTAWSSVATIYRFLIPQLVSPDIEKIIYLDSDIIVNLDIAELWRVELGDKILAAVPNVFQHEEFQKTVDRTRTQITICKDGIVKPENYFNAGVLLMNLKSLMSADDVVMDGIKFIGSHPQYSHFDQDVLAYCFSESYLKLPAKFNHFVATARSTEESLEKKIYHYMGQNFLWSFNLDMSDPFSRLWMDYFIRTPFFDADSIGRLYAGFQKVHTDLKTSMAKISAMMRGKTRVFFAGRNDFAWLRKIFAILPDEELIADGEDALAVLVYAMSKAKGKKIFFLAVANFEGVSELLQQLDFVPNRDFVNVVEFLSAEQGVPIDSHWLIKAM